MMICLHSMDRGIYVKAYATRASDESQKRWVDRLDGEIRLSTANTTVSCGPRTDETTVNFQFAHSRE